jgi:hypothetical protein
MTDRDKTHPKLDSQRREKRGWFRRIKDTLPWWVFLDNTLYPTFWLTVIFTWGVVAMHLGWTFVFLSYIILVSGGIGYAVGVKAARHTGDDDGR